MEQKKAAVVGWPIQHSKSPVIHGYWLDKFAINGTYEAIAIDKDNFSAGIKDLISKGYKGCNVTIPHKEAALAIATTVSEQAKAIGAANTLVFKDGEIIAENTDGVGFINNIKQFAPNWSARSGPAVVLGAGGAARAIIYALLQEHAPKIYIYNRTFAKAENLADYFGDKVEAISQSKLSEALTTAQTLINTTSLGMVGQPPLEIELLELPKSALVTDIVYNPLETNLLTQAKSLGLITVDGLGMLLHQAVPGFEAWFGVKPSVDKVLRQKVLHEI